MLVCANALSGWVLLLLLLLLLTKICLTLNTVYVNQQVCNLLQINTFLRILVDSLSSVQCVSNQPVQGLLQWFSMQKCPTQINLYIVQYTTSPPLCAWRASFTHVLQIFDSRQSDADVSKRFEQWSRGWATAFSASKRTVTHFVKPVRRVELFGQSVLRSYTLRHLRVPLDRQLTWGAYISQSEYRDCGYCAISLPWEVGYQKRCVVIRTEYHACYIVRSASSSSRGYKRCTRSASPFLLTQCASNGQIHEDTQFSFGADDKVTAISNQR
jgi:hypothetical protein